jgi:hypothetical protein
MIHFRTRIKTNQLGVPDLKESMIKFGNLRDYLATAGGSASLTGKLKSSLRINLNYSYRYGWQGEKIKFVSWDATHLLNFTFYHLSKIGIRWGVNLHWESHRDISTGLPGDLFFSEIRLRIPAFTLVNGFLSWRYHTRDSWWEVGLKAYNLLDTNLYNFITHPDRPANQIGERICRRVFLYFKGEI